MQTSPRAPALTRARAFLDGVIGKQSRLGEYLLPPLDRLAVDAGVSRMTMWHAVRMARERGMVRSAGSRGIAIVAMPPLPPAPPPPHVPADVSLEARLAQAIADGTYLPGSQLPSAKQLCVSHQAGNRRMRRALDQLEVDGLVIRRERRTFACHLPRTVQRATVVFVAAVADMSILADATPRSLEFWRILEQETAIRGLTISVVSLGDTAKRLLSERDARRSPVHLNGRPVLGFVCWNLAMGASDIAHLSAIATATGRPLAVFDELGQYEMPASVRNNRLCRNYPIHGTVRSGQLLGRFLLASGYRRVAYVRAMRARDTPRLDGIVQSYVAAGLSDAVTVYQPEPSDSEHRLTDHLQSQHTTEASRLVIDLLRRDNLPATESDAVQLGVGNLGRFVDRMHLRAQLTPTFAHIVQAGTHDVLVGDNDIIALLALEYLRSHGVRVPQTIGVAGFDDTVTAIGNGLTSYNWNVPGTVRSMMQFITRPREHDRLFRRKGHSVEVDGMVMARATTR